MTEMIGFWQPLPLLPRTASSLFPQILSTLSVLNVCSSQAVPFPQVLVVEWQVLRNLGQLSSHLIRREERMKENQHWFYGQVFVSKEFSLRQKQLACQSHSWDSLLSNALKEEVELTINLSMNESTLVRNRLGAYSTQSTGEKFFWRRKKEVILAVPKAVNIRPAFIIYGSLKYS